MISLKNISKEFNGKSIIENVSLTITPGTSLVVMGKSGVGKSLLFKIIVGIEKPTTGSVTLYGNIIESCYGEDLNAVLKKIKVGFLFQHNALLDYETIFDNVAIYLRYHSICNEEQIKQKVTSILNKLGLAGTEYMLPYELSGGMRRRAALARTLIYEPCITFYDEPTAGLDQETSLIVTNIIKEYHKKNPQHISLVITHDTICMEGLESQFLICKKNSLYISSLPESNPVTMSTYNGRSSHE